MSAGEWTTRRRRPRRARRACLDLVGFAEAVEHDRGARGGERAGDAEADAAGRAGDDRDFALERPGGSIACCGARCSWGLPVGPRAGPMRGLSRRGVCGNAGLAAVSIGARYDRSKRPREDGRFDRLGASFDIEDAPVRALFEIEDARRKLNGNRALRELLRWNIAGAGHAGDQPRAALEGEVVPQPVQRDHERGCGSRSGNRCARRSRAARRGSP